jgi:hypothetical protein
MPNAGGNLAAVVFDLHAAAPAEPLLSLGEISIKAGEVDGHSRRETLEDPCQPRAV